MKHAHIFRFEYVPEATLGTREGFVIAETWEDAVEVVHHLGIQMKQLHVITEAGQKVLFQGDDK